MAEGAGFEPSVPLRDHIGLEICSVFDDAIGLRGKQIVVSSFIEQFCLHDPGRHFLRDLAGSSRLPPIIVRRVRRYLCAPSHEQHFLHSISVCPVVPTSPARGAECDGITSSCCRKLTEISTSGFAGNSPATKGRAGMFDVPTSSKQSALAIYGAASVPAGSLSRRATRRSLHSVKSSATLSIISTFQARPSRISRCAPSAIVPGWTCNRSFRFLRNLSNSAAAMQTSLRNDGGSVAAR